MEDAGLFCGDCGSKLKNANAKVCIKCGCEPASIVNFCTSCGRKIASKNAIACVGCGASLKRGLGDNVQNLANKHGKTALGLAGAAILGAAAYKYAKK